MERIEAREVTVRIPPSMACLVEGDHIVAMLLDKALAKKEYFGSKIKLLESKYGTDFAAFKRRAEEGEENFEEWDDLLLWEGYVLAYIDWGKKHEDLRRCMT